MVRYVLLDDLPDFSQLATFGSKDAMNLDQVITELTGPAQRVIAHRPLITTPASDLSKPERDRQQHYCHSGYQPDLAALAAMPPDSGRNRAAYRLVCRFGRWVHHGLLPIDQLTGDVLEACRMNGLVAEDGARAVLATIKSGLRVSLHDPLPDLGVRNEQ